MYFWGLFRTFFFWLIFHFCATGNILAQSLYFDGATEKYVTLQHSETVLSGTSFTLEAWVFSPDWRNTYYLNSIFCTEEPKTLEGFVLRVGGGGNRPNAYLNLAIKTCERQVNLISPPVLIPNHWQHVAAVIDNSKATLYIDGQNVAQTELFSSYVPGKRPIRIGSGYYPDRFLKGTIDEVRIWNRSRTDTEILRDRAVSLKGNEPGLVGYFTMDNTLKNKAKSPIIADYKSGEVPAFGANYALADYDAGVERIEGPDVFTARRGPSRVQVIVRNHGIKAIKQIPLVYQLNGKEVLRDTIKTSLAPGERYLHKTSAPIFCTPTDTSQLAVYTALSADGWFRNDSARVIYRPTRSGPGRSKVMVVDSVWHNFGQGSNSPFHFNQVVLPAENSRYNRILMYVSLGCPGGGCDVWDSIGQIFLIKNGHQYELGRFITPYGIGCGPWAIDVTDFKSLLTGNSLIQSYVETWSMKGWLLSLSFEFMEGGPNPLPYQKVTPLWQNNYLVYGDAKYDQRLGTVTYRPNPKTRVITVRHITTGHGQGNTDNAGEYARKTHSLILKQPNRPDSLVMNHLLWKSDCDQNTCTQQKGSYIYSRAGWCPGQDVHPWVVNLPIRDRQPNERTVNRLNKNAPVTLEYRLEPYQNQKNTGYDDNQHTEPHFRIYGYLIEKSDSLAGFSAYHNVTCQAIKAVDGQLTVEVKNTGTEPVNQLVINCFIDGKKWVTEMLSAAFSLKSNETKTITLKKRLPPGEFNVLSVVVDNSRDENGNDDVATLPSFNTLQPKK